MSALQQLWNPEGAEEAVQTARKGGQRMTSTRIGIRCCVFRANGDCWMQGAKRRTARYQGNGAPRTDQRSSSIHHRHWKSTWASTRNRSTSVWRCRKSWSDLRGTGCCRRKRHGSNPTPVFTCIHGINRTNRFAKEGTTKTGTVLMRSTCWTTLGGRTIK